MTDFERAAGLFNNPDARKNSPLGRSTEWLARVPWLFVIIVGVPTLVAIVYYLLIASPIYVSEARFVVRSRSQSQPAALGSMLQSVGVTIGQGETDAYEVHEYMTSRDAAKDLLRGHALRDVLARPGADFMARFPGPFQDMSFESLYKTYQRFITVGYDSNTGISTLRVEAFRAADARDLATALLDGGEGVVNRLNDRAAQDAVAEARQQVIEAEAKGVSAQQALTEFRNHERLIDPARSSLADLDLVGKLEAQIATMRAERAGLAASAPENPQLVVIDRRIRAFEDQIETERARAAGATNSLAPKIGEYEKLVLERDFAVKSLQSAVGALESARIESRRKQLYLERVVSPDLPDKPVRPKRLLAILMVAISSLVAFATLSLVIAGLREHRQL
jgi:capsular polysaccharide transport system permease protein